MMPWNGQEFVAHHYHLQFKLFTFKHLLESQMESPPCGLGAPLCCRLACIDIVTTDTPQSPSD
jgi:hypothetical protein